MTLAAAHMSAYTTFQQLSFAPNFPLASIADEYIIPPTYKSFLEYRSEHEPEAEGSQTIDLAQVQFSPPGLPVPAPAPPSQWYYRDPKGVIHGLYQCFPHIINSDKVLQDPGRRRVCRLGTKMGCFLWIYRFGGRKTKSICS